MKQKDLIKMLASRGYHLKRSSKHLIYSNGVHCISVPHCKEVKSHTVSIIMKQLQMHQGFALAGAA